MSRNILFIAFDVSKLKCFLFSIYECNNFLKYRPLEVYLKVWFFPRLDCVFVFLRSVCFRESTNGQ